MTDDDPTPVKTHLTEADRHQVWRDAQRGWPYYMWANNQWRAYPADPRRHPRVISAAAFTIAKNVVARSGGLVEVP